MPANKTCFVIAPIGDPDSAIRKRADQVLKYIITPAAEECGFREVLRADKISEPGMITNQVIQHITGDAMVVADLTGHNANVFYELAIRHAIRRPYVQIIDEKERLPFDVAGLRTIPFTHQDLDSVDRAKGEMVKQMKSMMGADALIESPITIAVDLSTLSKSKNPEDRRFGEVLTAIAELTQQVGYLRHYIGTAGAVVTSSPFVTGSALVSGHSGPTLLGSSGVISARTNVPVTGSLLGLSEVEGSAYGGITVTSSLAQPVTSSDGIRITSSLPVTSPGGATITSPPPQSVTSSSELEGVYDAAPPPPTLKPKKRPPQE